MNKAIYVCQGTCAARISEEQYNNGLTRCGAEECTLKSHEFSKMYQCEDCGKEMKENSAHPHVG